MTAKTMEKLRLTYMMKLELMLKLVLFVNHKVLTVTARMIM